MLYKIVDIKSPNLKPTEAWLNGKMIWKENSLPPEIGYWIHKITGDTFYFSFDPEVYSMSRPEWADLAVEVKIPQGIRMLEDMCFQSTPINKIIFPYTLEIISTDCFHLCANLLHVDISERIDTLTIYESAFQNCLILEKIDLSKVNIAEFGYACFKNCKNLKEFKSPGFIHHADPEMFAGCESLETIDINFSTTFLNSVPDFCFTDCRNLTKVKVGNVYRIWRNAFYGTNLTEYLETSELGYVGSLAFYSVPIESFIFRSYILSIDSNAFLESNIKDFYFYKTNPPILGSGALSVANIENLTIHVPVGRAEVYKTFSSEWSRATAGVNVVDDLII